MAKTIGSPISKRHQRPRKRLRIHKQTDPYLIPLDPDHYERYLVELYTWISESPSSTKAKPSHFLQDNFNSFRITYSRNVRIMKHLFTDVFPMPYLHFSMYHLVLAVRFALETFKKDPQTHLHALMVIQFHETDLASLLGVSPVIYHSEVMVYKLVEPSYPGLHDNPTDEYLDKLIQQDKDTTELDFLLGCADNTNDIDDYYV